MNPHHVSSHPSAPADESGFGGGDTGSSGKIAEAKQKISQTARNTTEQVKSAAGDTASRVKQQAENYITEKKEAAAGQIRGYSSALHDSARSFEGQDPNIAHFAHMAADRVQQVADYVRTADFSTMRRDAEEMARRHPAVFFGGLFAVGLVLGNMATASRRRDNSMSSSFEPYRQDDWMRNEPGFSPLDTTPPSSAPVPEL